MIIDDMDEWGIRNTWHYNTYDDAKAALDRWNGEGEPTGWFRNPLTGRRRDENGNEYIQW